MGSVRTALGPIEFERKNLPPAVLDGRANPEYYRVKLSNLLAMNESCLATYGAGLPQFSDQLRGIKEEAKLAGIDTNRLGDMRSEMDLAVDAAMAIVNGEKSIFEMMEKEIAALESAMDKADSRVTEIYRRQKDQARERGVEPMLSTQRFNAAKKAWADLFRRVRTLQERARAEIPKGTPDPVAHPIRAAHVLRFMIYTGRSQSTDRIEQNGGVFDPAEHLCQTALFVYKAEVGLHMHRDGVQEGVARKEGVLIVFPMGHGKTEFTCSHCALRICKNPYTQAKYLHAKSEMAKAAMQYIAKRLDAEYAEGRRTRALYPNVRLASSGNKANTLQVELPRALKDHTLQAHGISEKASGANADTLYIDDPCDQKEMESETERDRTHSRINGTWLRRLRGTKTFYIIVGTIWHMDDAICRRMKLHAEGKLNIGVLRMGCGGPHGAPWAPDEPFASVWPEEFPPARLESIYNQLNDPSAYARFYMCDPVAEESRIVKRLRFYDPAEIEEETGERVHARFLASAEFHISCDPAAQSGSKHDRAGVVYAAMGSLRTVRSQGVERVVTDRPCLRFLDMREIQASQLELVNFVGDYAQQHTLDYVHVEVVSGFYGTVEMLRNMYGIDAVQHGTQGKKKDIRLRQVAPLLDDALGNAVVEFPGVREFDESGNPRIVPDRRYAWFYSELLNFGAAESDHAVDAVVHLVRHLTPDLSPGREGRVSAMVRMADESQHSARRTLYQQYKDMEKAEGPDLDREFLTSWFN